MTSTGEQPPQAWPPPLPQNTAAPYDAPYATQVPYSSVPADRNPPILTAVYVVAIVVGAAYAVSMVRQSQDSRALTSAISGSSRTTSTPPKSQRYAIQMATAAAAVFAAVGGVMGACRVPVANWFLISALGAWVACELAMLIFVSFPLASQMGFSGTGPMGSRGTGYVIIFVAGFIRSLAFPAVALVALLTTRR